MVNLSVTLESVFRRRHLTTSFFGQRNPTFHFHSTCLIRSFTLYDKNLLTDICRVFFRIIVRNSPSPISLLSEDPSSPSTTTTDGHGSRPSCLPQSTSRITNHGSQERPPPQEWYRSDVHWSRTGIETERWVDRKHECSRSQLNNIDVYLCNGWSTRVSDLVPFKLLMKSKVFEV